jgi:hypothetical protein
MARVTRMTKRRLGELLRAEGLITEEQVSRALEEQRTRNLFFGEALVYLGFITEEKIAETIARQFCLPYLSARQYRIKREVLELFPERLLREYQFVPLDFLGDRLVIICAGLTSRDILDELERLAEKRVCQYIGTWSDIRAALDGLFKGRAKTETTQTGGGTAGKKSAPAAKPGVEEEPVLPLVAVSTENDLVSEPDALNELGKLLLNDTENFAEKSMPATVLPPSMPADLSAASGAPGRVSAFAGPVGATRISAFRPNLGTPEAGVAASAESDHPDSAQAGHKANKEKDVAESSPKKTAGGLKKTGS